MAALHPAKHPRNRAQISETTAARAPRGPGTDSHVLQFLDRSRLLEVGQYLFVLGYSFSIELKRVGRHFLQRRFAVLVQICDVSGPGQGFERRCDHQLEVSFGEYAIGILPVHHFALLGDFYLARERALRLRNDGVMRWPAAASYCSA